MKPSARTGVRRAVSRRMLASAIALATVAATAQSGAQRLAVDLSYNFDIRVQPQAPGAAEYFAAQPYPKRIKVIESRTAPKVRLQGGMHMAVPANEGGGMVPIGDEIVEVPDDNLRAEARDTRLGFTAYVPPGTLNRGKQLAVKHQCGTCHGANLAGLGPVPPLAGRSPSHAVRQMFDMKSGTRRGPWAAMMAPVLEQLSVADMMAVSAYAASLDPTVTASMPR